MKLLIATIIVAVGFALNLSLVAFSQESTSSTWPPGELHCTDDEDLDHPFQCPEWEPGMPTYFPYPYNCKKYFECSNGNATCFHCAPGTVWNDTIQTCDHEAWTDCVIVTTGQPPVTTPPPTTPEPTTTPTTPTTTTPIPTTDDPGNWICPDEQAVVPHPWYCNQFYICIPGEDACLQLCPDGTVYNPEIGQCDNEENYQCELTPPPTNYRSEFFDILQQECHEPTPPQMKMYNRVVAKFI